jgi:hypothetical protein
MVLMNVSAEIIGGEARDAKIENKFNILELTKTKAGDENEGHNCL